jgi:hypothetical protein
MKKFISILGLLLLPLTPLSAQVTVEVTIEQELFLPGEALPVAVKIRNHSGQTLHMGDAPDWLTFSVESNEGFVVRVWENSESVIIGRAQLARFETNVEYCQAHGIPIVRRSTTT